MKGGRLESRSRSRSRSTGSRGASWSNKFDGIGGFQVGSWGGHATSLELLQLRLDDIDGFHDVVLVLLEGVFLCANRVESSAESAEVVAGVLELGFQFSLEHEILNLLLLLVQCFDLFSHEEDVVDNTIHFDFVLLEDQSYLLYPTAVVANLSALSDDVGLDLAQGTQKLFLFVTLFVHLVYWGRSIWRLLALGKPWNDFTRVKQTVGDLLLLEAHGGKFDNVVGGQLVNNSL